MTADAWIKHLHGEHPSASLNLFPHPQPLSHVWERGGIILVPLLPCLGEGVRG
jgi:hypothetical protein